MTQHSPQFTYLNNFIRHEMRMSHVYQPVMLRELLRHNGSASISEIARALLFEDRSQVEYYEQITKNMVGRVLTKNRGITERVGDSYQLKNFEKLSADEVEALVSLCDEKIDAYLGKRSDPWSHRRKSAGYVPGTQRYEVLKRARYRCELCGISAEHKALEVDHIVPRNKGGGDETTNLQALCYSCNATKRDRDDSDFRGMADRYKEREAGCIFCEIDADRVVAENELCFVIQDRYPVTPLHRLIIPKRHVSNYFDLYQPEINAIHALLHQMKVAVEKLDPKISGFNVGANVGADAGQTVMHAHVHLIPRRPGDVAQPRGGIRGVIPGKQSY